MGKVVLGLMTVLAWSGMAAAEEKDRPQGSVEAAPPPLIQSASHAIETAYDREAGQWRIGWPGRVAKHDVVYQTPPGDPTQGVPLGSGDVGVLCWTEGNKLILVVNKSDLWDDARFERFQNWAADQEDVSTTLRHAGRIVFDFKYPVFDAMYLSDFEGRLRLADATLTMRAVGPFGVVEATVQVLMPGGEIVCRIKTDFKEPTRNEITLERYGSRTFSHWYSLINRDASIGLRGTRSGVEKNIMYITHELTSGMFVMAARVIGGKGEYEKLNEHTAVYEIEDNKKSDYTLTAVVTDPAPAAQLVSAKKYASHTKEQLLKLNGDKIKSLVEKHEKLWKEFWLLSMMEFGDDYYDNLWHLAMYFANTSQRGKSPGRFCNGLWSFNRDTQNWNFYFHWNQQQIYWPLNAAGHHDLCENYLKYRFDSLPWAKKDAAEVFKAAGAMVSDVADRRGCNSKGEFGNHTPVAEIALDFWRQYQYTGDERFLKTRALPYMIEAATFFETLFEKGDDGLYHAKNGTGYEGWIQFRDCITELTYGKVLFEKVLEAGKTAGVELPRAERWRDLAEHMSPPKLLEADEHWMTMTGADQQTYKAGPYPGRAAPSRDILSCGYSPDKKEWVTVLHPRKAGSEPSEIQTYRLLQLYENGQFNYGDKAGPLIVKNEWDGYDGIFPTVAYTPVFPSGMVGLGSQGTRVFNASVNMARFYAPEMMGWDPLPIMMARLGLGDELADVLKGHPDKWQFYCNGLGHYGPINVMKAESTLRFSRRRVCDASLPEKERQKPENQFLFEIWPFRHMDLEAISVFSTAMNEALLQSYDGLIRVAPAVTTSQSARFTLHAVGGFVVSSEIRGGRASWVSVRSERGGLCRIANPWSAAWVRVNGKAQSQMSGATIEIVTQANDMVTLTPNEKDWENWRTVEFDYPANSKAKISPGGMTTLGLPRMF